MKLIFSVTALLLCSVAMAQNDHLGKWKPVYFKMDKLMTGDVKADSISFSADLDEAFKDDKDPQASKAAMQFMAEVMLKKMKDTEEAFVAPGVYIETNTRRNSAKTGTFTYNEQGKVLTTKLANRTHSYRVAFKADRMVLTTDLESSSGVKGVMDVEYERVK